MKVEIYHRILTLTTGHKISTSVEEDFVAMFNLIRQKNERRVKA